VRVQRTRRSKTARKGEEGGKKGEDRIKEEEGKQRRRRG
jgi:hypothetical protein